MNKEQNNTEHTLATEQGTLVYTVNHNKISIKRYRGMAENITVPDIIDAMPVTGIERKAFLSCKTLKEIQLPESVEEIGDWAFAHAESLRTIILPAVVPVRGKELFLGCKRLKAMAVTVLHDYFLFDPQEIGSDAWVKRWDEKLLGLVWLDDLDGFEELWTCGEEDYEGKDYDIKSYPVEKRKMKLRIVYFRLLHPYKLSQMAQEELKQYLRSHTKGTAEPEAWDIIIEEHSEALAYYKIFAEAGCINNENFDALLADMAKVGAEAKAYLLRYQEEHLEKKDAFAAFALD